MEKIKTDWTAALRRNCATASQTYLDRKKKLIQEKTTISGESLYAESIEQYLAKGGTVKVQPTINAFATDPYNDWNKEADYTARRDWRFSTFATATPTLP